MSTFVALEHEVHDRASSRRALVRATAQRSLSRRRLSGRLAVAGSVLAVAVALAPLLAMVGYTTARGIRALSVGFLTRLPTPPGIPGGGIENAIVGSSVILGLATAMAVPVGLLTAVFLLERRGRLANSIRFVADVLSGVPSIAIGIFAYTVLVEPLGHFSGLSGSFALAVLMLPISIRANEAALRAVPRELWDGGLALGVRRSRVVRSVVVRSALGGLVTGNLLAVARAVGETAPLLFTTIGSQLWNISPSQPTAALPLVIYTSGTQAFADAQRTAWGAALVLLAIVLVLSVVARVVAARLTRSAR